MNLQEAIDKYEDKATNGQPVLLLAIEHGWIVGLVFLDDDQWCPSGWRLSNGENLMKEFNLVSKKKPLPKDVLCEVWSQGGEKELRYSAGEGKFYCNGADSLTYEHYNPWDSFKVIENPIRPWFGGECPIPEGCAYRVRKVGLWSTGIGICNWGISGETGITAYQILGEA